MSSSSEKPAAKRSSCVWAANTQRVAGELSQLLPWLAGWAGAAGSFRLNRSTSGAAAGADWKGSKGSAGFAAGFATGAALVLKWWCNNVASHEIEAW